MYSPKEMFTFISDRMVPDPVANAAVFNTMRILKLKNPGDTYFESYRAHYLKYGESFFDYYHLLWSIGSGVRLENVMEIGCRTGISICQLMSAMADPRGVQVYLLDTFSDGYISSEVVKMNMRALNLPTENVNFIVGDSLKTVPQGIAESRFPLMNYILVDGCHDKPVAGQDLENVVCLLKTSGILIFDDISPDGCDLLSVWEDFKKAHEKKFFFIENMSGKGFGVGVRR